MRIFRLLRFTRTLPLTLSGLVAIGCTTDGSIGENEQGAGGSFAVSGSGGSDATAGSGLSSAANGSGSTTGSGSTSGSGSSTTSGAGSTTGSTSGDSSTGSGVTTGTGGSDTTGVTTGSGMPTGDWPNEPAGSEVVSDWGFDALDGGGWYDVYDGYTSSIELDPSAPLSASNVLQQRFPAGLVGGNGGGGGSFFAFPTFYPAIYWGFWMKVDANFEQHPVFTKIAWIHTRLGDAPQGNQLFLGMDGEGPFQILANYQNGDIDNSHLGFGVGSLYLSPAPDAGLFNAGEWVRIETYFKPASCTTCQDGIYRIWTNGELTVDVTNLNTDHIFPDAVSHITIWGGTGSTKTRDSFIWWDHEHVSVPPG